jgi:predicted DsbA family dithiol-disulfide isomerase
VYPGGRNDTFTVSWKAYQLDPSAPAHGISWTERHVQKLAQSRSQSNPQSKTPGDNNNDEDKKLSKQLQDRLASIGRQEGIAFSFAGKIGNTRSAHRAIAFAKTHDSHTEDKFVMALFAAYFEGEADITSHEHLADVAESVGLDRRAMLAWLESEKGGEEVDEEDRVVKSVLGVKGVPCFTVQGHTLDGAQDVQAFLEFFVNVKEEGERTQAEAGGEAKSAITT